MKGLEHIIDFKNFINFYNKIQENEDLLLTDPELIRIRDQIRNLEKQIEALKQQEENRLKQLRENIQNQKNIQNQTQSIKNENE